MSARLPPIAPSAAALGGSPYSGLVHRLAAYQGEVYPFHVGDTWMAPATGCRMEDLTEAEHPGMHKYTSVHGHPELLDACVEALRARTGVAETRDEVLVTAGATGGLAAVAGALVAPGSEVLILAPFWPLIAGMVRAFHGTPVPVPVVGDIDQPEALREVLEAARTERTVAVYLNTPNNPTGYVLPRPMVEAVVAFARAHGLWVWSDEVYDQYVYEGEHVYARALAPERTISAYSFSKAYGMAGNRAGFLAGPKGALAAVRKISTHTFYSTPTASQLAAAAALRGGADAWVAHAAQAYATVGRAAAERLGVRAPQGSTFLWLDVADQLDPSDLHGSMDALLGRCVDRGILCAPGRSFGPYPTRLRMCFTAAAPEVTLRGVEALAEVLGR
mgnify:CR=1 FL=1